MVMVPTPNKPTQLETKYYKLEKLCAWEHIKQLNSRLLDGESPTRLSDWCRLHGFSISIQKLYEYKALLQSSLAKEITVEKLLGISAAGIPAPRQSIMLPPVAHEEAKVKVRNELQVLDLVIQRGFDSLLNAKEVSLSDTLKAIEMKNKLTQGKHAGLTEFGLEQVRELEDKKFGAILEIIKRYVPSDKWEEMDKNIADIEYAYYLEHAPEYLKQYEDAQTTD